MLTAGGYYTVTTLSRDTSWTRNILLVLAANETHACVKVIGHCLDKPVVMLTADFEWHDATDLFDAYASVVPVQEPR